MKNSQFNGLILVDKPSGMTSHDVVARLRRYMGTKSVGHSGTLDPLASGLMVCLVNEGTKLSQYILEKDKGYEVELQLGIETDTLDITGQVLRQSEVKVTEAEVLKVAEELQGTFDFPVPIYSAIKVQGKKLYEYAREEKSIEVPHKEMKFWDLRFLGRGLEGRYRFAIACSKGSYIRTWVEQLGKRLGCGATMTGLRRTWSTPYRVDQAWTLEQIEKNAESGWLDQSALVPMNKALMAKSLAVKGQDQIMLLNGQISHHLKSMLIVHFKADEDQNGLFQILSQPSGQLLAIVGLDKEKGFVIRRGFKPL